MHKTFGVSVIYQLSDTKKFIFRADNPDWKNDIVCKNKELHGYMYVIEKDDTLDVDNISLKKKISQHDIRQEFYKEKDKLIKNKKVDLSNVRDVYDSMYIQLKFLSFENIVENMSSDQNKSYFDFEFDTKGSGFIFYKLIDLSNMIWFSAKYAYIFDLDIFKYKNKIIIDLYREYNEINYLESINIIIQNKLFEPTKQLIFTPQQSTLILEIKLKKNKKTKTIKENYIVNTYKYITDPNFYLMCDLDIIINFEQRVNKIIEKDKFEIIEEDNYLYNYLRNKILKKLGKIKTIRQLIKEDNKN